MNKLNHRCDYVNLKNPLYIRYHDEEWGVLELSDQKLYELLILESFQAGLSWECLDVGGRPHYKQQINLLLICQKTLCHKTTTRSQKRGAPAGSPPVTGLTGVCNAFTGCIVLEITRKVKSSARYFKYMR
ncbi:MAG: DNA-3-methyladenine glycosylase I [Lachnospiraceae bacterium]|nr:DNA-3-methyladenine glycosylase I [Lachnospiraceae bacterium]